MPTSADTSERRHSVLRTRREWSLAEKRAIVAESRLAGANISAISRRHGAAQSLIYQWRKMFPPPSTGPMFLPVSVGSAVLSTPMSAPVAAVVATPCMIEIELAFGRKLRVASDIDVAVLKRLITALESA